LVALYEFLKLLVKIGIGVFYRRTTIINAEKLRFGHGAIVISNHPSTMLDPLNIAANMKRQVSFLANASMFSTPFTNWLFTKLYCVPIQRAKDKAGKHINNAESFQRCDEFLGNDGVLWIAPEGGSEMERKIRPFKTGTARIGFSAENQKEFELNLPILPVGLSYSAPDKFRSNLVIHVGDWVYPKDFREAYEQDSWEAVRTLTDHLEQQVKALAIDLEDEEEEKFISCIEVLLANSAPLDEEAAYYRTKKAITQLRELKASQSEKWQTLHQRITDYFETLEAHKLKDEAVAKEDDSKIGTLLALVLGIPFFIFGWINNFIPAFVPGALNRLMNLYPGYSSTVKMWTGLLTFPLWYFFTYKLISGYFHPLVALGYLVLMLLAGYFALGYARKAKTWFYSWQLSRFKQRQKSEFEKLQSERAVIWQELSKVLTLS
jgi:1-acyl-sn-glycerol-3-phosphate acyltransferase